MMNNAMEQLSAIAAAVIGVAIVAVLVSQRANTSSVIQAAGTSFSQIIGAAVSPISGGSTGGTSNNLWGG